jgi:hypothetical protein
MELTEEQLKQIKNKLVFVDLATSRIVAEKEEINKLVKEIKEILNGKNENS